MNILVTIPHYFNPRPGGRNASLRADAGARADALKSVILSLHENFGNLQATMDQRTAELSRLAAARGNNVRIIVVTTQRSNHVLDPLAGLSHLFLHVMPDDPDYDPRYLGIKCREVQGHAFQKTGEGFDFYCYLEDDGIIHDPWFFEKLRFFNSKFGNECLLLPARYEVESSGWLFGKRPNPPGAKLYPEGDLPETVTLGYPLGRGRDAPDEVALEAMGRTVRFRRPLNPHAGCYFLNPAQMKAFLETPYFLERSSGFMGPLESAATLGILKRFVLYKPHPDNLAFFELQHYHPGTLGKATVKVEPAPNRGAP
jgi:hypothetical protein